MWCMPPCVVVSMHGLSSSLPHACQTDCNMYSNIYIYNLSSSAVWAWKLIMSWYNEGETSLFGLICVMWFWHMEEMSHDLLSVVL